MDGAAARRGASVLACKLLVAGIGVAETAAAPAGPRSTTMPVPRQLKGENKIPVTHEVGMINYCGERTPPAELLKYRGMKGDQKMNQYSQWIWRQYASSVWMDIRIDRVLPFRAAKDAEDEKHVHPLQLDVIERAVNMWSNPGEKVLTPFLGVGSEAYGAVLNGRMAIGAELKQSYFRQAIRNMENIVFESDITKEDQAGMFADGEAA